MTGCVLFVPLCAISVVTEKDTQSQGIHFEDVNWCISQLLRTTMINKQALY